MKKIFLTLLILTIFFQKNINAQITLEHTYDSAGYHLYMVNLEIEGMKYIHRDYDYKQVILYNLNHSVFKTMPLPDTLWYNQSILYVSQHLFNLDDQIEFIFVHSHPGHWRTLILNELGDTLFYEFDFAPLVAVNIPQEQQPIYNTANGAKMILTNTYTLEANVYSLTGTLANTIEPDIFSDNLTKIHAYPNPASGQTHIQYQLPTGETTGEIVFYNLSGAEVKRYKVGNAFSDLIISTADLASGSYYYQLQTPRSKSEGKKLVVIK